MEEDKVVVQDHSEAKIDRSMGLAASLSVGRTKTRTVGFKLESRILELEEESGGLARRRLLGRMARREKTGTNI